MRSVLVVIFVAGCNFGGPAAQNDGGTDATSIDGPPDAQRIDGAPGTARKRRITIPAANVFEDLTAFPMFFVITDATLAQMASTEGDDIYFTKPDGSALEWERLAWDKGTGHLEAWVRTDLADATVTELDLRYGDPGPAHAPNPVQTWSNGFAAVWHFDDALGGSTSVADARNAANGTARNNPSSTTGKLGKAIAFDGNDDEVTFTSPIAMNDSSTISAWVKLQAPNQGFSSIMTVGNSSTNQSRFLHTNFGGLAYGFYGNDVQSNVNINNNQFTLVHWTYDGAAKQAALYRDGVQIGTTVTITGTIATNGTSGHIGTAPQAWGPGGNTTNPIKGVLDEVRIANVARSAGWIKTEVANQTDPAAFYTIGPDQPAQ